MIIFLSSNAYSHDDQINDALRYAKDAPQIAQLDRDAFLAAFPEWPKLVWDSAWVDTKASGVDPDYTSWVCDWIEANSKITWRDGEPVIFENEEDEKAE